MENLNQNENHTNERAAQSSKEQTAQSVPTEMGPSTIIPDQQDNSPYYEFLQKPELYEVYAEVRSKNMEVAVTKIRFLCMSRLKSIAPEHELVSVAYASNVTDRMEMLQDLNSQFLLEEAEAVAAYVSETYRYDCTVRQIELPVGSGNIPDIASLSYVNCSSIQTVSLSFDVCKNGLSIDVLAYYEIAQPLPFIKLAGASVLHGAA